MATYYVNNVTGNDSNNGTSEGSAWATLAKAASTATTSGDVVYVKATGTSYSLTATVSWASVGITIWGYTTTPGADDGRPIITSSSSGLSLFAVAADKLIFRHLQLTHTGSTRGRGAFASGANRSFVQFIGMVIDGCLYGVDGEFTSFYTFLSATIIGCEFKNCTSHAIIAPSVTIDNCWIHDNVGDGWRRGNYSAGSLSVLMIRNRFASNSGIGLNWNSDLAGTLVVDQTVVRGSGSHGISFGNSAQPFGFICKNTVIEGSGGYGMNASIVPSTSVQRKVAFRSNTSGTRNNMGSGEGDVTLTADPWENAVGGDYRPNGTAGGGLLLRGTGFAIAYGNDMSAIDIGPVQRQVTASGGGISKGRAANTGGF